MLTPVKEFKLMKKILQLTFLLIGLLTMVSKAQVPDSLEFKALKALYESTDGSNWTNNTGWPSAGNWPATATAAEMGAWFGVTVTNGDVTQVKLPNNNLSGTLPESIGDLSELIQLKLNSNQIGGSIPISLGNPQKLVILLLYNNLLTGNIPIELGNLTNLVSLQLHDNVLTGTIPSSLGNCTKLKFFYLRNANMSGSIPASFENLTNLQVLFISSSGIGGNLPSYLGNFQNLNNIYLFGNNFTGSIPENWQNLINLQQLVLHNNNLSGPLPLWLKNINNLRTIYLSSNNFTGDINAFIGDWPNLTALSLTGLGLDGKIPESIGNLTKLTLLHLSNNNFIGDIDVDFNAMSSLVQLYLQGNSFTSFPNLSSHPNATNLKVVIQDNYIPQSDVDANLGLFNSYAYSPQKIANGNVPDEIEFQALKALYESTDGPNWTNNTGWPSAGNWPATVTATEMGTWFGVGVLNGDVSYLALNNNKLIGEIPSKISLLISLTSINFSVNTLSGSIPVSLGSLINLQYLYLHYNSLIGTIPSEIGNLSNLISLYLYNNELTGNLPPEIGGLVKLKWFWVQGNQLSGTLPVTLGNMINLTELRLQTNQFTGNIPSSIGNLSNLVKLYLSSNQLSGSIPPELGNLNLLRVLHLNYNQFTGTLPKELGDLENINVLYLHSNQLSGSIPTEFSKLINLTQFYVSGNQLSGEFPQWLGNSTKLHAVFMGGNQFTGSLPANLSNLTNLITFRINNNKLEGAVTKEMVNHPNVKNLYLYGNQFTSIPNLSDHVNASNLKYWVHNNKIAYSDIEANLNSDGTHNFNEFIYTGQGAPPITYSATAVLEGTQLIIDTHDASPNNTFTWEKQVAGNWVDVTAQNENPTGDKFVKTATADDAGMYRYTVTNSLLNQTKTSDPVEATTIHPKTYFLNQWAFQYKYDGRRRMVEKQVPGAGAVFMVYDNRDRLVLTQDSVQRGKDEWLFTKYDAFNRPVATGIYTDASTRDDMQTTVNDYYTNLSASQAWYESLGTERHNYDNKSFPQTPIDTDYLTLTYYDNYTVADTWAMGYEDAQLTQTTNAVYSTPTTNFTKVKGQVTASMVKNLDDGTWLKSVVYYDDKYRVIQTVADNSVGGIDRVSSLYDFVGKVLETKSIHSNNDNIIPIKQAFDYDHAGRLMQSKQLFEEPVVWKDLESVFSVDEENTLSKSGSNQWSDYAQVEQFVPEGQDGWLSMEAKEVTENRFFGFDDQPSTTSVTAYGGLNYSFYLRNDGGNPKIGIYESGSYVMWIPYISGDRLKIEREGNKMNYFVNDVLVRTTNNAYTGNLYPRAVIKNIGTIYKARIATEKVITSNTYNELGELIEKNLHSEDNGSSFAQSVDYRYNIRGWLTSINDNNLSDGEGDYFGMELLYNNQDAALNNSSLFNGNISAVKWTSGVNGSEQQAYTYNYDPMNRITNATSKKLLGTWLPDNTDMSVGQYDLNGNIKTLSRNETQTTVMDNLAYTYVGNQLQKVTDSSGNEKGFKDGNTAGNDYGYDGNGNMTEDKNKDIASIAYNHLNLPERVDKNNGEYIKYSYDATGVKLAQEVYDESGLLTKRTDYSGAYIYETTNTPIHTSDFGIDTGDYTAASISILGNIDGVSGSDDNLELICTGDKPRLILNLATDETARTFSVEMKVYIVGSTGDISNIWLRYPDLVYGQSIALVPNEWNTIMFNNVMATGDSPWRFYLKAIGNQNPVIGSKAYLKDIIIREFTDSKLAIIQTEEGRIVPNTGTGEFEYQYHLKDHLGNARVSFTTKNEVIEYLATMETEYDEYEEATFSNIFETRKDDFVFNHTDADPPELDFPIHSAILNNDDPRGEEFDRAVGPAKSLRVAPGDVVNMEVFAQYVSYNGNGTRATGNSILTAIASAITPVGASPELAQQILNNFTTAGVGALDDNPNTDSPLAYLNYILFDNNFQPILTIDGDVDAGFDQVTTAADGAFEKLEINQIPITQAGYMYIYVSNENAANVNVYFDDLKITHTKSKIVQMDDYYPFGLSFNSFKREDSKANDFLYNGKEMQDELDLGWLDYGARMYMADLGRWFNPDLLADKFTSMSPYNYVLNNPIVFVDPDGNDVRPTNAAAYKAILNTLTAADQAFIQLDKNGYIDKNRINEGNSESGNFQALQILVNSEITTEFTVSNNFESKDKDGNIKNESLGKVVYDNPVELMKELMGDAFTDEMAKDMGLENKESANGKMGITITPGGEKSSDGDGRGSTNGNIQVIINDQANENDQARTAAHEGYGHALFEVQGKNSSHNKENNPELETQIKKRVNETEKNLEIK